MDLLRFHPVHNVRLASAAHLLDRQFGKTGGVGCAVKTAFVPFVERRTAVLDQKKKWKRQENASLCRW